MRMPRIQICHNFWNKSRGLYRHFAKYFLVCVTSFPFACRVYLLRSLVQCRGRKVRKNKVMWTRSFISDTFGRTVWGVGLQPLVFWARGFISNLGHGYSSVVYCVGSGLCDVLITRSEKCVCVCVCVCASVSNLCDLETPTTRQPRPDLGCCVTEKQMIHHVCNVYYLDS
jgi:hypothetical protein